MVRWEVFKLARQRRTYLGLGVAVVVPVILVVAIRITQDGPPPGEVPLAAQILSNGLVIPFIALGFGSVVLLPLLAALVAGDSIAGEVSGKTLKTILSRSVGRSELFWSKAAAVGIYTLVVVAVYVGVSLLAGWLVLGVGPLAGLGGTTISVGEAVALAWASAGFVALPLLALAAFALFLSAATRNSVASVGGGVILLIILQLLAQFDLFETLEPYFLTSQLDAWLNFLRDPIFWPPVVRAAWVSLLWAGIFLVAAWAIFVRRDVLS